MRSRYTAFVLLDADYLLATWHPRTRPARIDFEPLQKWLGLQIRAATAGGQADDTGVVEFVARFRIGNQAGRLHEVSRFERLAGRWCYVEGDQIG